MIKILTQHPANRNHAPCIAILLMIAASLPASGANTTNQITSPTLNLGIFPSELEQTATFTLSNATERTLTIKEATSCCAFITPVLYRKSISPHQTEPMDVFIDARLLTGPFKKYITLMTNDPANPQIQLWITGTAQPSLSTPEPHLFAGQIPLHQEWSTNLTIQVREEITNQLQVAEQNGVTLEHKLIKKEKDYQLSLHLPPQKEAKRWQSEIILHLKNNEKASPLSISIAGYIGTQLLPQPRVISISSPTASLRIRRTPATNSAPLQIHKNGIIITEQKTSTPGEQLITLTLTEPLFQRLKEQKRIPIELTAEGAIPTSIMLEYQAD